MMSAVLTSRLAQILGATTALLGMTGIPGLDSNNAAYAQGFVRRASDVNNPFYEIIDEFQQFANTESRFLDLTQVGARQLDPNKLNLQFDHEIKIYFLNEGAGYRNQLGVTATGNSQFATMVFNDITCLAGCSYTGYRSPYGIFGTPDNQPLAVGDYYSLGLIEKGTSLDFFLRRDGFARTTTDVWHTDTALNSDGLQHVMAYEYQNYLVLAWEDLKGGGDQDYNDVVFAIDFGDENLEQLESVEVPETSFSAMGYAIIGAAGILLSRRPVRDRP